MNDGVTLTVDTTICVGIGQCEVLEPDVFFINDDAISTVVDGATLPADRAAIVIERCPSGAISIVAPARGTARAMTAEARPEGFDMADNVYRRVEPEIRRRGSLSDEIAAYIRDLILTGALKPGEKIDQDAVSQALDVSRSPIREALVVLGQEGLLDVTPGAERSSPGSPPKTSSTTTNCSAWSPAVRLHLRQRH